MALLLWYCVTGYGMTLKYNISFPFIGSTSIFLSVYKYFKLLSFYYWPFIVLKYKNKKRWKIFLNLKKRVFIEQ